VLGLHQSQPWIRASSLTLSHRALVRAAAAAFVMTLAVIWSTASTWHILGTKVCLADRIFAAQTIVLVGALLVLMLAALFAERRWSEAALKESKERLQLALDGAWRLQHQPWQW